MATSSFVFVDDGREMWDRQKGEPAEQFDWFTHWRNEGHRRSYARTAEKFEVKPHTVRNAAKRNKWGERLAAYKADNSQRIQERYDDLAEQALVPFVQATARLAAWAVQAPIEKLPPDRALTAATGALRLVNEPSVKDLIRISAAHGASARELDALDVVLDQLAERFPDAHDAALDALAAAVENGGTPPAPQAGPEPGGAG